MGDENIVIVRIYPTNKWERVLKKCLGVTGSQTRKEDLFQCGEKGGNIMQDNRWKTGITWHE